MTKQKKKQTMHIDFNYFRNEVDIAEVADLLGLKVSRNHSFFCPCHPDTKNPSAKIRPKNNTWKCFTCADVGGSPLDLVQAVQGGSIRDAALFLNEYFPGGIEYVDSDRSEIPVIPPNLLAKIGLKHNPFFSQRVCGIAQEKADKITYTAAKDFQELDQEWLVCAAELVVSKCAEYLLKLKDYKTHLFHFFPELDKNARDYILQRTEEEASSVLILRDTMMEYICDHDEYIMQTYEAEEEKEL